MSRRNTCFLEETGWFNFLWLHPLMRHLFLHSLNILPNAWQKWMRTEAVGEYILYFSPLCSIWVSRRMKFSRWILQSLKWLKTWQRWLTSMKHLCCMPWGGAMTIGWSMYVYMPLCWQHAGIILVMSQPSLRWKKILSSSILIWGSSSQNAHWAGTLLFSTFILLLYISLPTDIHGRGRSWDDLGEWHWNMYNIIYETSHQSRFDARYWMRGAGALGWPRGMVWGERREEGSGWGTHVYLWRIHFDIWQNQYNIVKLNKK